MPLKPSVESPFQPPLELLRLLLDYNGWYDRDKCTWRYLANTQLLAAMAPPSGGREVGFWMEDSDESGGCEYLRTTVRHRYCLSSSPGHQQQNAFSIQRDQHDVPVERPAHAHLHVYPLTGTTRLDTTRHLDAPVQHLHDQSVTYLSLSLNITTQTQHFRCFLYSICERSATKPSNPAWPGTLQECP